MWIRGNLSLDTNRNLIRLVRAKQSLTALVSTPMLSVSEAASVGLGALRLTEKECFLEQGWRIGTTNRSMATLVILSSMVGQSLPTLASTHV